MTLTKIAFAATTFFFCLFIFMTNVILPTAGVAIASTTQASNPNNPALIGATYNHFGDTGCDLNMPDTKNRLGWEESSIVVFYDRVGVRDRVKKQLVEMRAGGMNSIGLVVWHVTDNDPTISYGPIPTKNGKVDEPYATNMKNYFADVRDAGFNNLFVTFAPQWTSLPSVTATPTQPYGYDPNTFEQTFSFYKDVRRIAKENGPTDVRFDIYGEGAPLDYEAYPNEPESSKQARLTQWINYSTNLWSRWMAEYGEAGRHDSTISFVAPMVAETTTHPLNQAYIQRLVNIFGGKIPDNLYMSFYPYYYDTDGSKINKDNVLTIINGVDQMLVQDGATTQTLNFREGYYNNPAIAQAVQEFNATHTRKITHVLSWPQYHNDKCPVAPPFTKSYFVTPNQTPDAISHGTGYITSNHPTCTIESGKDRCSLTISWDSKNATGVRVRIKETPDAHFADAAYGSQEASWITPAGVTFDLVADDGIIDSFYVYAVGTTQPITTPSPTPSSTPVVTPSATPSSTPSPQPSVTPSPTPSSSPSVTPSPSVSPTPNPGPIIRFGSLQQGEKKTFGPGTVISGDVKVNGVVLYDNDPQTGLIVLLQQQAEVEAPWGAGTITNTAPSSVSLTNAPYNRLQTSGCGSTCRDYKIVTWPDQSAQPTIPTTINPGEKITLPANIVVSGDIKVNGEAYYDSDPSTGLVVRLTKQAEIEAPWGATVYQKDSNLMFDFITLLVDKIKQFGCGSSCTTVQTKTV